MAIPWAIAARRGQALNRLKATIRAISDKYGIAPMTDIAPPKVGQDPLISQMLEAEAFAAWLDALAPKLGITAEDIGDYESMTKEALTALAGQRGVDTTSGATKDEIIAALTAEDTYLADHDYGSMTVAELRAEAEKRQIDLGSAKRKDDIIAVLRSADDAERGIVRPDAEPLPAGQPAETVGNGQSQTPPTANKWTPNFAAMPDEGLKQYATDHGIDLGAATSRDDIIAVIRTHEEAAA